MLINCVAYEEGRKLSDIPVEDIDQWLLRPGCFVWVALRDATDEELRAVQHEFGLHELAAPDTCILIDCLTLWLSNLIFAGQAAAQAEAGEATRCPIFAGETTALIETLPQLPGRIILVSNEVGWGIVPMHPVSRLFADEQGRLNQRVAAICERVTLVAAGLPLILKSA